MTDDTKHAIVLRGPSGCGKSACIKELIGKLGPKNCEEFNLDHGWGPGEFRHVIYTRYNDIKKASQKFVLIEIGFGEYATSKPYEWTQFLREKGYIIRSFRFNIGFNTCLHRNNQKASPMNEGALEFWYGVYYKPLTNEQKERYAFVQTFPQKVQIEEIELVGDNKDPNTFANEIIAHIGLSDF